MGTKIGKNRIDDLRNYKVYTALLSQTGTAAPTVLVLENTLGASIVWTRSSAGIYIGTLAGVFTADKTFCISEPYIHPSFSSLTRASVDVVSIAVDNLSGVAVDGYLNQSSVEIRVYN